MVEGKKCTIQVQLIHRLVLAHPMHCYCEVGIAHFAQPQVSSKADLSKGTLL